ncbi:MAG: GntR family transcriptional regulator [Chloroflexia bacterium]|nr:GntR family transcriptional regulator [Chloroflexia bacterium]
MIVPQPLAAVLSLPPPRSLADDVADRLREAIVSGHFGPGERLREETLAKTIGVSRGPVREAFARLQREGLIVIRRNRGAIVARLAEEDLEEVYSLRVAIEVLAVLRAAERADGNGHARLQAIVDRIAVAVARGVEAWEAAELDMAFHDELYELADHRRLRDMWLSLRPQIFILLLDRNVAVDDFRDYVVSSHQDILDALRERDAARAVALLEDHLRGSYERVHRQRVSARPLEAAS